MPIKKRFSPEERIRLIENWLPLVQSTNQQLGWNLDSASLEALIVKSAPDLRCCCTAIEAYTVLVSHYINYSQKER
jgi:hypothetical protein